MNWHQFVVTELVLALMWGSNHWFFNRTRTKSDSRLLEYYQYNPLTSVLLILLADVLAFYDVYDLKQSQPDFVSVLSTVAIVLLTSSAIILSVEMTMQRGFQKNQNHHSPPSEKM